MADDKRATQETAADLHGRLADLMLEVLAKGEVVPVLNKETGEVEHRAVTPSPAMIAQINAFLKNNNIQVVVAKSPRMHKLADAFEGFEPPERTGPDYASH